MSDIKIIDSNAATTLRNSVRRIETLEHEKTGIAEDIKEVYAQIKQAGFDVPTVRAVIKRRQKSERELQEAEYLLSAYESALEKKVPDAITQDEDREVEVD